MKIEVGKFYKTRDGKKAFVFNKINDRFEEWPFEFVVIGDAHFVYSCTKDGRFYDIGENEGGDLVEEWEEPK